MKKLSKYVINPIIYGLNRLENSYTQDGIDLGPLSKECLLEIVAMASTSEVRSPREIILKVIAEECVNRGVFIPNSILGSEEAYLDTLISTILPKDGFFGIPTCRHALIPENIDGFILGVPFDGGSPKPGSRSAPEILRAESINFIFRGNSPESVVSISKEESPFKNLSIVDIGDLFVKNKSIDFIHERTYILIKESPKKSVSIIIGGDHSITLGAIRGIINKRQSQKGFSIVQFDSHCDMKFSGILNDNSWVDLHDICHANFISKILEEFKEITIYQIGVDEFQSLGLNTCNYFKKITKRLSIISDIMLAYNDIKHYSTKLPKNEDVYLSIDADVFSRPYVEETSYPSRCGIDVKTFFLSLKYIFENNNIIGIDFMEFSPRTKYSKEAKFMTYILLEIISLFQSNKRK